MISLAGLELSDDLTWENEFDGAVVAQSVRPTLLGTQVVQVNPLVGGREIRLSAIQEGSLLYGYFTRAQVQAIREMERSGAVVEFVYEEQSFSVVVKAGGINVRPLVNLAGADASDYYLGTIILIEV